MLPNAAPSTVDPLAWSTVMQVSQHHHFHKERLLINDAITAPSAHVCATQH